MTTSLRRRWIVGLSLGAIALALPFVMTAPAHLNIAILVLMAAQTGVAWNIVGGYAGQISLGHAAFFGLGAYTSTMLYLGWGVNPWLGMLAGAGVAALSSMAVGWSCFRLKGHYFAMATIAIAEIVQIVFTNWEAAGAAVGLTIAFERQGFAVMIFSGKQPYYYVALGLLALTLLTNLAIERSFFGLYFRAIKDEPDAARSLGVNLALYKQIALAISAAFTALGGSFYAFKELYIDPGSVLSTSLSIKMALVSILGGVGTLFGPLVGAAVLTSIEEATRTFFGGSGRGTDVILYALLIIAVAIRYPSGIVGGWRARVARIRASRIEAPDAAR